MAVASPQQVSQPVLKPEKAEAPATLAQIKTEFPSFPEPAEFPVSSVVAYDPSVHESLAQLIAASADFTLIDLGSRTIPESITVRKPLWLRGDGASVTGDGKFATFTTQSQVIFEKVLITQDESSPAGALQITEGHVRVYGCTIKCTNFSAVVVCGSAVADIEQSEFSGSQGPLVYAEGEAKVRCSGSLFHDGKSNGLVVMGRGLLYVDGCQVYGNPNCGVAASGQSHLRVTHCSLHHNGIGIGVTSNGSIHIANSTICDHNSGPGIYVIGPSVGAFATNCELKNNPTLAVNATNGAAVKIVSTIIDSAPDNVMVSADTYGIVAIESSELRGKGQAALAAFDNGRVEGKSLSIEGVEVAVLCYQQGTMVLENSRLAQVSEFAVQARDCARLELANLTISDVKATGIIVTNSTGFVRQCLITKCNIGAELSMTDDFEISSCEFSSHASGALAIRDRNKVILKECSIKNNDKVGAEVSGEECKPVFENCYFEANGNAISIAAHSSCKMTGGTVTNVKSFGIGVTDAEFYAEGVTLDGTVDAGISVSGKLAKARLEGCSIQNNQQFGAQVYNEARARFVRCLFSNRLDILCLQSGKVQCRHCTFPQSQAGHCNAREAGYISMKNCELSNGGTGIGIQIGDATLKLRETNIHNESKFGVVIGTKGVLNARASSFYECGIGGLFVQSQAKAQLEQCTFSQNGEVGIQATGCELSLLNCIVKNHKQCGIFCTDEVVLREEATQFEANEKGNIVRK
jgi:hypothetical protein